MAFGHSWSGGSNFALGHGYLGFNRRMITLYGIGDIFEGGHGETKDLRVQWALEEAGLEYRFHALDQTAGDLESESYARLSPFHQVPVIEDDGFFVAESAAILLYIA